MNNLEELHSQFEAYTLGAMSREEKIAFLKKIRNDEGIYKEYLLWARIDYILEQIPEFELKKALKLEEKETKIIQVPWYKKPIYQIAASLLILLGFSLYIYKQSQGLNNLTAQINYSEINIPKYGQGSQPNNHPKITQKQITATKYNQADTTYLLTFEPFKLEFRVPKVEKSFGKGFQVVKDYESNTYKILIEGKTYLLFESKKWQGLKSENSK